MFITAPMKGLEVNNYVESISFRHQNWGWAGVKGLGQMYLRYTTSTDKCKEI